MNIFEEIFKHPWITTFVLILIGFFVIRFIDKFGGNCLCFIHRHNKVPNIDLKKSVAKQIAYVIGAVVVITVFKINWEIVTGNEATKALYLFAIGAILPSHFAGLFHSVRIISSYEIYPNDVLKWGEMEGKVVSADLNGHQIHSHRYRKTMTIPNKEIVSGRVTVFGKYGPGASERFYFDADTENASLEVWRNDVIEHFASLEKEIKVYRCKLKPECLVVSFLPRNVHSGSRDDLDTNVTLEIRRLAKAIDINLRNKS